MNNEARKEQEFVDEHPYITWCDEPNTANDDGYHELPDGSVTTSKLADGAVTLDKTNIAAITTQDLTDATDVTGLANAKTISNYVDSEIDAALEVVANGSY